MLGYVYVMSNEAMPGLYKVGCTSRNPYERANDLNTTGVPVPFVVEYCINIDNYENIEKLVHTELSSCNFGKEFFKCDLEKCILTIKNIADSKSKYSEWYCNDQLKNDIYNTLNKKDKKDNKLNTYKPCRRCAYVNPNNVLHKTENDNDDNDNDDITYNSNYYICS